MTKDHLSQIAYLAKEGISKMTDYTCGLDFSYSPSNEDLYQLWWLNWIVDIDAVPATTAVNVSSNLLKNKETANVS